MPPKRSGCRRTVTISVEEFVRRIKAGEKLKLVVYKRRKLVELVFPEGPANLSNYRIPSSKTTSLYVNNLIIRSFVDGKYLNGTTKVEVMHGKPFFQIRNDGQSAVDLWQENPTAALRSYFEIVHKEWNRSNNGKLHLPIQEPVIQAIIKEWYKAELEASGIYSEINTRDVKEVYIRNFGSSRRRVVETDDDTADSLTNSDSDEEVVPKNSRKRRAIRNDDFSDELLSMPIQPPRSTKRTRPSDVFSANKQNESFRGLPEPLETVSAETGLVRFAGEFLFEEPVYDADDFSLSQQEFHFFANPQQLMFNASGY